MKLHFLTPAEFELRDAVDYYNSQLPGLGYELVAEVKRTLERIVDYPEAWHPLSENTRRCRLNRFPYSIVYAHTEDEITVVAFMHMSRHPDSWKGRKEDSTS